MLRFVACAACFLGENNVHGGKEVQHMHDYNVEAVCF